MALPGWDNARVSEQWTDPAHPADAVLATLDPEQREVATALHGPVCVLAGAGTGKTRAITHRIAYGVHTGVYVPQQVLAVTFTARAAGEMRARLRALGVGGVQARTFHAAALRQLTYFWPRQVGGELPRIAEHKAGLVAEAAGRLRLRPDRAGLRDLAAEVEWTKVTMTDREAYPAAAQRAGRIPPAGLNAADFVRLLDVYEQLKRERAVIDFEDVLLLAVGLLADHPAVAATVRAQYHHIVVDEYQDVSPLQQALLDQWLGDHDELCVVGDANQTIYSFTGATPRHLLDFRGRHPQATVVRLVRDYRSTPQVVALANRLLDQAGGRAARDRLQLLAQRPPGPGPEFTEYPDEPAEAAGVATAVRRLLATGVRASEVAVLYRTNAQSEALEQALTDVGVAYLVRGGERFFARVEVRQAIVLLRGAARSADTREPLGAVVRGVLSTSGWSSEPPAAGGSARERWGSLNALVGLADDVAAARPAATLPELVAELDDRAGAQHPPTVEGVTLASLHAAKGLEWDAVFLIGLSEGMVPITYAETAAAIEEERRLLYVGVTRAREHLALSWSLARSPGAKGTRRPSRFLDGLRPDGSASIDATTRPGGRSSGRSDPGAVSTGRRAKRPGPLACRSCGAGLSSGAERKRGRCPRCPATYDEALFDRLRSWRLTRAQSASLPAYVVFTDATLAVLAETMPSDERELAAVPGVGRVKLDRYGAEVLALLRGEEPPAPHEGA